MYKIIAILIIIVLVLLGITALIFVPNNRTPKTHVEADALSHEQKMWCLAACAVLTQRNQDRHDIPGGVERTDENINRWMQNLSDGWSITDRRSLFDSLRWLKEGGHRQHFVEMASYLTTASEIQLGGLQSQADRDSELANRIDVVKEHSARLGEKNLVGWDFSRYISLCGWGYVVGYITEEEAWELMLPVAKTLQDTFDSWEDLGRNYLIGRQFWSLKETQEDGDRYVKAYDWLCSDPGSPWLNIPWELDLNVIDSDEGAPATQSP